MCYVLLGTPVLARDSDKFIEILSQVPKLTDNVILLAVFTALNRPKCPDTYFSRVSFLFPDASPNTNETSRQ
jgi:hypothetical protein